MQLNAVQANALSQISGLTHGFFGREGGGSTGLYNSLNVGKGSQDDRDSIRRNRERIANALQVAPANLATVYQVHSADVVTLHAPFPAETTAQPPRADAIVTATKGLAIGILTADCGPVLFADPDKKIIAAAHAGWRGAKAGVLENTIDAMCKLGAERANIIAAIGPMISQDNYEVGPEFHAAFTEERREDVVFFKRANKPEHFNFDLPSYIVKRLKGTKIGHIENQTRCTYAQESQYFSYRRATHAQQPDYGRQISAIAIN
ncbi:peptidoglycan editing factor PgeF [Polycladidibacter hongkongensis]|uniref:peptidoglycan editing factor PgeF n=1 Tax=Polycladidibacter hongkongensis TaxID=1647556 RepID=UPI000833B73F|nr:peptidoglycan editing factor PgeF [Pseudovibrio hongkongensis]